jgi:hypothetical protein
LPLGKEGAAAGTRFKFSCRCLGLTIEKSSCRGQKS